MSVVTAPPGHASTYLARAAVTAPSAHETPAWVFVADGDRGVELHADADRRLLAGPHGRDLVISCGAALFNVRLAMRHLGFKPVEQPFPDPRDPAFLARVAWGAYARPTPDEERMYGALRRRPAVRGPFLPDPLPTALVGALREQAQDEGAGLHLVDDSTGRRDLAELVRAGEDAHRADPEHTARQSRWTWRLTRTRGDGVPADVPPDMGLLHPDRTGAAEREYAALTRLYPTPPRRWPARTGLVAVLGTDRDDPPAWLRSGQALERVLLAAAAQAVTAAFHTQPLELPPLRDRMRQTLSAGEYPQMVLRLGYAPGGRAVS
ncbi:Acg family FMN-binding oxidoreductase [Streptomyces sp. NPDC003697]